MQNVMLTQSALFCAMDAAMAGDYADTAGAIESFAEGRRVEMIFPDGSEASTRDGVRWNPWGLSRAEKLGTASLRLGAGGYLTCHAPSPSIHAE